MFKPLQILDHEETSCSFNHYQQEVFPMLEQVTS